MAESPPFAKYAAICQLELGQTAEAATAFRLLRENPAYTNEATWYLAMTFLKENNDTAYASILRQIQAESRYFGVAQGLLGDLGRRGFVGVAAASERWWVRWC